MDKITGEGKLSVNTGQNEEIHEMGIGRFLILSSKNGRPTLRVGSRLTEDAFDGNSNLLLKSLETIKNVCELHRLLMPDVRFGASRSEFPTIDAEHESNLHPEKHPLPLTKESFMDRWNCAINLKNSAVNDLEKLFDNVERTGKLELEDAWDIVGTLHTLVRGDPKMAVASVFFRESGRQFLHHSVNVSILAMYFDKFIGFGDELAELGLGALLHDIGKLKISRDILNKPGPLNHFEMRQVKSHPKRGMELLLDAGYNGYIAKQCIIDHHERTSGEGYPDGKYDFSLGKYAKITAISEVYDALISDWPYRKSVDPLRSMLTMVYQMSKMVDAQLLDKFIHAIGFYPIGTTVSLNIGEEGIVVDVNQNDSEKPLILAISGDRKGNILDLRQEKNVKIRKFTQRSFSDCADLIAA